MLLRSSKGGSRCTGRRAHRRRSDRPGAPECLIDKSESQRRLHLEKKRQVGPGSPFLPCLSFLAPSARDTCVAFPFPLLRDRSEVIGRRDKVRRFSDRTGKAEALGTGPSFFLLKQRHWGQVRRFFFWGQVRRLFFFSNRIGGRASDKVRRFSDRIGKGQARRRHVLASSARDGSRSSTQGRQGRGLSSAGDRSVTFRFRSVPSFLSVDEGVEAEKVKK